jgi:hypothetical protein
MATLSPDNNALAILPRTWSSYIQVGSLDRDIVQVVLITSKPFQAEILDALIDLLLHFHVQRVVPGRYLCRSHECVMLIRPLS